VTAGSPARASLVISGARGVKRWEGVPIGVPEWSPDGATIAIQVPSGPRSEWLTQSYDAASGAAIQSTAGRALWSPAGRLILSDGDPADPATSNSIRVGQRIDLISGSGTRTITDARRLAASPLLRDLPDADLPARIDQVLPSADPTLISVMLARTRQGGATVSAFVVVRVADGEPVHVVPVSTPSGIFGLAWSPVGGLVGWDVIETTPAGVVQRRAVVVDPVRSRTVLRTDGRFAGWAPDGTWAYIARDEGLYAYPIDGRDPVRVAPFGVSVVATKP
jgi:hypothetical protein